MVAAVDNAGNVIWYYDYDPSLGYPYNVKLLPNGHMLMGVDVANALGGVLGTVQEIDLAGNVISQFTAADITNWLSAAGYLNALGQPLIVYAIHHDVIPLPNGHLIAMINYLEKCTNISGCVGTQDLIIDAIVDLDQNHKPVWLWDAFDHQCSPTSGPCLDINRRPMASPDWLHNNSLVYSSDDGNLIVSVAGPVLGVQSRLPRWPGIGRYPLAAWRSRRFHADEWRGRRLVLRATLREYREPQHHRRLQSCAL